MNTLAAPDTLRDTTVRSHPAAAAPRFDMYGPIHKALRSFMCDTLVRIGRMDPTDTLDRDEALAALDTLLTFCAGHLTHENDYVHAAIEARQSGGAQRTAHDHVEHVASIQALRAEAQALRDAAPQGAVLLAHRLYHHLALFVAENFQHMHVEETVNNAALWALYSDAELVEIHDRLLASLHPAEHLLVARWMVPAVAPQMREILMGQAKAQMPPESFLGVVGLVRPHLDTRGWERLAGAIGVPVQPLYPFPNQA